MTSFKDQLVAQVQAVRAQQLKMAHLYIQSELWPQVRAQCEQAARDGENRVTISVANLTYAGIEALTAVLTDEELRWDYDARTQNLTIRWYV